MRHISFIFPVFLLTAFEAWALMPPFTDKELESRSDTIVIGEVTAVKPTGKKEKTSCVTKREQTATLEAKKTLKGKNYPQYSIKFDDYDFEEGCVGSPDHRHFVGESGKFYLSCNGDDSCALTHWNGVVPVE